MKKFALFLLLQLFIVSVFITNLIFYYYPTNFQTISIFFFIIWLVSFFILEIIYYINKNSLFCKICKWSSIIIGVIASWGVFIFFVKDILKAYEEETK